MEILGIGPGEFILILIMLLVVVGPERLPGLARSIGQFLVRARNWLQTSPDAALVMRARAEIEAELASIKNSLLEVQVVRDEVLGAARQFEDSVNSITPPKLDLNGLVNAPAEQTIAANGQAVGGGETPALAPPENTPTGTPLDQLSTRELPSSSNAPSQPPAQSQLSNDLNGLAHMRPEQAATSTAPALAELESINIRLQAIMADMWALQQQLKQRGALDEAWQPPSLDVQLPSPEAAPVAEPPTEPPAQAEPIEDEAVLAAHKPLEELTPMQVAYHAPHAAERAPEATATSEEGSPLETAGPEAIAEPLAPKPRKRRTPTAAPAQEIAETPANGTPATQPRRRRAVAAIEPSQETAETPANGAPAVKTRKRRAPAADAERSDATEPVTTEKAS